MKKGNYHCAVSIHDPQIYYGDGRYWMVGSHLLEAVSDDLKEWQYTSCTRRRQFSNLFDAKKEAFDFVGKFGGRDYAVWAENTVYNETMQKYVMYFATTSSYIKSDICMAVSDNPEGPWEYRAKFLCSGWTSEDADRTDVHEIPGPDADTDRYLKADGSYDNDRWPNSIDPAVFTDTNGRMWLVYGSWSGGIFLIELDRATGVPVHPEADADEIDRYYGYHLLGGGHHPIEAPYIVYDGDSRYYYLFLSYGELRRDGGYQIREFRSRTPDGPYLDAMGRRPMESDGDGFYHFGLKLMGNYTFPGLETAYKAPGGQSAFKDRDGNWCIVYHQRFDGRGEDDHEDRVHRLYMTAEGWLLPAPFELAEEQVPENGYGAEDLEHTVYIVDHGTDVSAEIHEACETRFKNGQISGAYSGTYEVYSGTDRVALRLGENWYNGLIRDTYDEAGNRVRTIIASGTNNQTIWGVIYL